MEPHLKSASAAIVVCTGPTLSDEARRRAAAQHASMSGAAADGGGGGAEGVDEEGLLQSRLLTPLQIHHIAPISNQLLAAAYFSYADPREARRALSAALRFFRVPPYGHFFHGLRCWSHNRAAFPAAFGKPDLGDFLDPSGGHGG